MGNEKALAPDPSKEAADQQAAASLAAGEAGYVYQRADGTVERAHSAEDAFRRCPVLGELALKSPDQANILLELAAAGNEIIAAEAKKVPQKPQVSEKTAPELGKPEKIEPKKQIPDARPARSSQTEAELINPNRASSRQQTLQRDAIAHLQTEPAKRQTQDKSDKNHNNEFDTGAAKEKTKPSEASEDHDLATAPIKIEAAKPAEVSRHEPISLAKPKAVEVPLQETIPARPAAAEIKPLESESEPLEIVVEKDRIENKAEAEMPANEAAAYEIDDAPQAAMDQPEEPDEPEMFLSVATDSEEHNPASADELVQVPAIEISAVADAIAGLDANPAPETEQFTDFETIIADQPASEEPVNLESIREQADAQPLEQTLAQLVEYLSEPAEKEIPGHKAIWEILHDVEMALPATYDSRDSQQSTETEPKPQITPEMIEKLLILLRTLGYQHPHEALISFIKLHGLAYALQAITYMCQLKSPDNQQEFFVAAAAATTNNQNGSRLRLGKLLFGLAAVPSYEPST